MILGVLAALIASAIWIIAQNICMHIYPAKNRIRAMVIGCLAGVPLVFLAIRMLIGPTAADRASEPMGVIYFHAFLTYLLLFFLYAECFYHIERAVTLRVLVEMLDSEKSGGALETRSPVYNAEEMTQRRLEALAAHKFTQEQNGRWTLRGKGIVFARLMRFSAWLFQSAGQRDQND